MSDDPLNSRGWNRARAHNTLMGWAQTAQRFDTYGCPSPGTIIKHLGLKNSADLWEYVRTHLEGRDNDEIEVRIVCPTRRKRLMHTITVADWQNGGCPCPRCNTTVGETRPHILKHMANPDPTWLMSRTCEFVCSAGTQFLPTPHTVRLLPEIVQKPPTCTLCWTYLTHYPGMTPGQLVTTRGGPVSTAERRIQDELQTVWDGPLRFDAAILLAPQDVYPKRTIKPDIILPDRRIVIEIDGGDGKSGGDYSRHDTEQGRKDDQTRDLLLTNLDWKVIRIRRLGALELHTPATILTIGNQRPKRIVAALVEHLNS